MTYFFREALTSALDLAYARWRRSTGLRKACVAFGAESCDLRVISFLPLSH